MKLQSNYIKQNIDPDSFYQHELKGTRFKRHGWNEADLCPFHNDTKPGSFHVNTDTGAFKCFSCGHSGGDIIDFTRLLHDLKFTQALENWLMIGG